ncbi:MAG: DUF1579 domain-containing protein [Acidobacteriota bacterium]|nr:DUF1579 domain-containing protein [Acidobacteriota bacterium]
MKPLLIALAAVALCFGAAVADHHEGAQSHEGHAHAEAAEAAETAEAAAPPMGPPAEMKELEIMNGTYTVKFFYKENPMGPDWTETEATAVMSPTVGGGAQQMLFEGNMMGMDFTGMGLTSFDRETKKWQMIWVDSMGARISNYTGDFKDGSLVVSGKDLQGGMTIHSRLSTYNITEKGFDWKYEMSLDGTTYLDAAKATYTKQ